MRMKSAAELHLVWLASKFLNLPHSMNSKFNKVRAQCQPHFYVLDICLVSLYSHDTILRPGRGRWIHMKKTAHQHASAMAAGLLHQKRCGEPDAGPYCIAKPSGGGRVAEYLAWFLSILYGGYASTVAIESPGGDDDQQWLTFWVMFVASMFLEQTFARVLLSKFPFYYQVKLAFIVWLIFFDGAATVYRWLRMRISQWSPLLTGMLDNRKESAARLKLNSMISTGGTLITDQIDLLEWELKRSFKKRNAILFSQSSETECFWEYDYTDTKRGMNQASLVAEEQLYQISKWLISSEGIQKMEDVLNSKKVAFLLERAVTVISFEPKLLNIHLISTTPGEGGKLPVMDQNGKADCYVKFALVSEREFSLQNCTEEQHVEGSYMNRTGMAKLRYLNQTVTSRTAYRTIEPEWNEILEMPIKGGMGEDGTYRNYDIKDTILIVEAWDADCEKWGIALEVFLFLGCVLIFVLVVAYIIGAIDFFFDEKLSAEQWWWKATIIASTLYVAVGMLLSWMMSVVLKADDDFIGISAVPLEILTDQRGHSLILKLRKLGVARGSLRVKLRLSEN